ncbi:hypothetical protein ACFLSW_02500 [Candidatus Bipolaricaulota bacterium]
MRLQKRLLRFKRQKTAAEVNHLLRELVRDASQQVRFYRDLYLSAGIDTDCFNDIEDLAKLPIVTKEALLRFPEADWLRKGRTPFLSSRTSTTGTTGYPFTIYLNQAERYFRRYTYLLSLQRFANLRFPLRIADVGPMVPHHSKSIEQRMGFLSLLRIPGNWPLAKQREALIQYRPTILEGYPTCLQLLAETLSEREARRLAPRLTVSRGETLGPQARKLLERVFRSPVVNLYSCEEVGAIAWECPDHAARFHVNHDTCVCEVVAHETEHGRCDVAVTNLYNRTMPFIRYKLGDAATRLSSQDSVCSCGAGTWLEGFEGRDDDLIAFPDGHRVSPRVPGNLVFNAIRSSDDPHLLKPEVARYQILQDESYALHVHLQIQGTSNPALRDRILSAMAKAFPELPCTVEEMETPELTAGGEVQGSGFESTGEQLAQLSVLKNLVQAHGEYVPIVKHTTPRGP